MAEIIARASDRWQQLAAEGQAYLRQQQVQLNQQYGLDQLDHMQWHQAAGEFHIFKEDQLKLIVQAEYIGSFMENGNNWLWAWANDSIPAPQRQAVTAVKTYGEQQGLEQLTEASRQGTSRDGWQLSCIAAMVLEAKGIYVMDTELGAVFLLWTDIQRLEG